MNKYKSSIFILLLNTHSNVTFCCDPYQPIVTLLHQITNSSSYLLGKVRCQKQKL
nr:MAG TPA: hypothetical protein [Caudoviricetes sp.]